MSSSHLFLGLPIALLVLYFELSSGFHSAAFINNLSLGDVAIHVPASNLLIYHLFHGFVGASFNVVYPILLQSQQRQSLRHCHSRMKRRCPGHCVSTSHQNT